MRIWKQIALLVLNQKSELEAVRLALASAFVERAEFKRKFPATMKPAEFVDSLLATIVQTTGVDLASERSLLIGLLDDSANGRAAGLWRDSLPTSVLSMQTTTTR